MGERKKRLILILLIFLLTSFLSIEAEIPDNFPDDLDYFNSPDTSRLWILPSLVELGEIKTDPFDSTIEYFERTNALFILFIPPNTKWQLVLTGEDFRSGGDVIPLRQMEWMKNREGYKKMPKAGKEEVIAKNKDQGGGIFQFLTLSFKLKLEGDEVPGRYSSSMIISLISF